MFAEITWVLQNQPLLFFTFVGLLGLIVGSFLNVVIHRIPIMLEQQWSSRLQTAGADGAEINLFFPRSHCPHCKKSIAALSNIPLFSYLFLGGKSACCQKPISLRYPLVEALSMALSIFVAVQFGLSWECLGTLLFSWTLLALVFIDIDHQILPDNITLPLMWAGLLINTSELFATPVDAVYGAAAGYLIFCSIAWIFKRLRQLDGLGQGDCKLLAACGAWMGWQLLPYIVLLSSLLGIILGSIYLLLSKKNLRAEIPFGPFIAIAAFTAILWGDKIMSGYLSFTQSLY